MGSLIQQLIRDSELVLYHDYRSRSFRDWSGNGNDGVPTSVDWTGRGIQFPDGTSWIQVPDSLELRLTEGTLVALGDFDSQTTAEQIVSKRDAGGTNYGMYIAASFVRLYDGTNTREISESIIGKKYIALNMANGETGEYFADGISQGNLDDTSSISANDAPLYIGNYYNAVASNRNLHSTLWGILIINRKLTPAEHASLYDELVSLKFPTTSAGRSHVSLLPDTGESSLVGAWDMDISDGIISDSAGTADMTVIGGAEQRKSIIGKSINLDGDTQYCKAAVADYRSSDSAGTISVWGKAGYEGVSFVSSSNESNFFHFLHFSSHSNKIYITQLNSDDFDDMNQVYADTTPIKYINIWQHFVLTSNGSRYKMYIDGVEQSLGVQSGFDNGAWFADTTDRDNITIGVVDASGMLLYQFKKEIASPVEIYNEEKDVDWVTRRYLEGARAVQFKTGWGVKESIANETSGLLSSSSFQISTGTWKVTNDTINGSVAKCIENVADGILYIPTTCFKIDNNAEAAYGSWEFWVKKTDAGEVTIGFISTDTTANGYNIVAGTDETVKVAESGVGDMITGGSIAVDTWTKIKVTRRTSDEFELFVDDISIGTASDDTIIGSDYLVFDMDAGDKILYSSVNGEYCISKHLGTV